MTKESERKEQVTLKMFEIATWKRRFYKALLKVML